MIAEILRLAAGLGLTGVEACLDGVFAPSDQGFAPRISRLRYGPSRIFASFAGFCVTSADKNER